MSQRFIPLVLFFFLAVFLYLALRSGDDIGELPSPLMNTTVPALGLPLLEDTSTALHTDDMHGQVWILNVWASWCAACLEEHPLLMELAQAGIPIIGLNYKDKPDDARQWLARHGNPYQQVIVDADGLVALNWGVYGVPETFLIDRLGILREKFIGPISAAMMKENIYPWFSQDTIGKRDDN